MTREERHEADSQIIELRKVGKSFEEIADITGRKLNFVRSVCRENLGITRAKAEWTEERRAEYRQIAKDNGFGQTRTEDEIKEKCLSIGYEYLGGYSGTSGKIKIKCLKCGFEFNRGWQNIRRASYNGTTIHCNGCVRLSQSEKKLQKEQIQAKAKADRERNFWNKSFSQMDFKQCKKCGKLFYSTQKRCYCSERCLKAVQYAKSKDKRLIKIKGAYKEYITLNDLFKRDNGICHICGQRCDYSDYQTNDNGVFIAGENYPSIDHIIPLSKGGVHSWENVKLAHRACNTRKGNKISNRNRPTVSEFP